MSDPAIEELMLLARMPDADREAYFNAMPPDNTSTLLVADLEAMLQTAGRDELISRAKGYYYDDFKSILNSCPKLQLHHDLLKAGYTALADNALDGKYD